MADKRDKRIIPKQQLEIVKVMEEKSYGTAGKALLPVTAKNLSLLEGDPLVDKSLKHTVFNQDLKTFLQSQSPGARFICDLEERERPDSEYGPDRNIVQIYVNGKPVAEKKKSYGKSIETVQAELAAQAKNNALTQAVELAAAGKIGLDEITGYADTFLTWLMSGSSRGIPSQAKPEKKPDRSWDPGWEGLKSEAVPDIFIDLEWLHEHLKILKWADVLDFLHDKFRAAGDSVTECLGNMTKAQQDRFVQEIQNRLEKMPVEK